MARRSKTYPENPLITTKLITPYSEAQIYDPVTFEKSFNEGIDSIGASVADKLQAKALEVFSPPLGGVKYPIMWTTEKQRKAFFASDGFGRGIPTRRTGKVSQGWKVTFKDKVIKLYNRVPYARYVYGGFDSRTENQQRFHRNTGWITGLEGRQEIMTYALTLIDAEYYEEMRALIGGMGSLR